MTMNRIEKLIRDNKYLLLLLYLPVYLAAFFIIDNLDVQHSIIRCGIDNLIPFNEYFVIPYAFWFIWFPGVAVFFMWHALKPCILENPSDEERKEADKAKADFVKLCIVMFTSMTVSLIIYVIFPNGVGLREPIEHKNICASAVELIRAADTPYGVCPSIHVATIAAELLVIRDSKMKLLSHKYKIISYIITALIAYSTMAIKQHSIIDVVSGALLAGFIYVLYIFMERRNGLVTRKNTKV